MFTELTLLATRLTTSMNCLFFRDTRSIMTRTLTCMSTGQQLSTNTITEHLLTITRNSLYYSVTSLTHPFRQLRTRRTGTKVTSMIRIQMTSRTALRARKITDWWRSTTHNRRLDHCLSTGTGYWCRQDVLTRYTRTSVTWKITLMLPTVQEFITCLCTHMECTIRFLSFMRTTQLHTLVTTTIQIGFTRSCTDEWFTSFGNFLFRQICRTRSIR